MEKFICATVDALNSRNWYAALTVALTMPDICGKLQDPSEKSPGVRYRTWCDRYLMPAYPVPEWSTEKNKPFLTSVDIFSLRCGFLHAGTFDLDEAKIRTALTRFHFVPPPANGGIVHCNLSNNAIQLQVDIFCADVCNGVHEWIVDHELDEGVQERMSLLGRIG